VCAPPKPHTYCRAKAWGVLSKQSQNGLLKPISLCALSLLWTRYNFQSIVNYSSSLRSATSSLSRPHHQSHWPINSYGLCMHIQERTYLLCAPVSHSIAFVSSAQRRVLITSTPYSLVDSYSTRHRTWDCTPYYNNNNNMVTSFSSCRDSRDRWHA
jgi:hypothetical protein